MEKDHFDIRRARVVQMIKTMKKKEVYEDQTTLVNQLTEIIKMDEISQHSLLWNEYEVWVFDTSIIYLLDMALEKEELRADAMHCLCHLISKIQISHKRIIETGVMKNFTKIALFETREDITNEVGQCLDILFEIPASTKSGEIIEYIESAELTELTPGGVNSLLSILNAFAKHSFRKNPYIESILRICKKLSTHKSVELLRIVAEILKIVADTYVDGKECFVNNPEWFEIIYDNLLNRNMDIKKIFCEAMLSITNRYPEILSPKIKKDFFQWWRKNAPELNTSTYPKKISIADCKAYGIEVSCIYELNRGADNQLMYDKIYKFQSLEEGYHEVYRGLLHSIIELLRKRAMTRDSWGTLGLYMGGHMTVFEDLNEMVTESGIVDILNRNKDQNTETSPVNFLGLFVKACYSID